MPIIVPTSRPRATFAVVVDAALKQWRVTHPESHLPDAFLLGVRGYYSSTMGKPGNDVGIYDDGLFAVDFKAGYMYSWNFNTDPSRYGVSSCAAGKCMARLNTGCWTFIKRYHRLGVPSGHPAFGQGENEVTYERVAADGAVKGPFRGCIGIDLHRGSTNSTSSAGCQTLPPDQWDDAYAFIVKLLKKYDLADGFAYILTTGPLVV